MNTNPTEQTSAPQTAPEPAPSGTVRIKAFGVGTAGVNVLEQLVSKGFPAAAAIALNAGPALSTAALKLQLPSNSAPAPLPSVINEEQADRLKTLCQETDFVLVVTGLGGKSGTRLAPTLARAARESGATVIGFALMPFECEGNLRTEAAELGLRELREAADLVVCLPNDRALAVVGDGASLLATFKASDELLATAVAGSWQALLSTSLMGLSFPELCGMARELSTEASFAAVETSGPTRVKDAIDRLFAHPMLAGTESLKEAAALSVFIVGGPGLPLTDVNGIMEGVRKECGGAPVLMGAATRPGPDDRLLVALLVARHRGLVGADNALPVELEPGHLSPRASSKIPGGNPDAWVVKREEQPRPGTRILPPAPEMSQESMEQLRTRQTGTGARARKPSGPKLRQTTLPLEIISKGRFDKSEPTIHKGEDLDVPTYIRRGVQLN